MKMKRNLILLLSLLLATLLVCGCGGSDNSTPSDAGPVLKNTTLTVSFQGPGGHSNGAYGNTNAVHAAGRGIQKIIDKTTALSTTGVSNNITGYNGGNSVNSIASDASYVIQLYAPSDETLASYKADIIAAINAGVDEENSFRNVIAGTTMTGGVPAWIRVQVAIAK